LNGYFCYTTLNGYVKWSEAQHKMILTDDGNVE
jgi:hypothetical protein